MNTKITIKNSQDNVLQFAIFHDQKVMDDFIELLSDQKPYGSDYHLEYEDMTAKFEQEKINEEAMKYLAETDYMVVRAMEDSSKPVSPEIKLARAEARLKIIR